jgi:hypothetical protein
LSIVAIVPEIRVIWFPFAENFIKIHTTLRTSPAMAAGVTDRLFDVMDLVKLLIESESAKAA